MSDESDQARDDADTPRTHDGFGHPLSLDPLDATVAPRPAGQPLDDLYHDDVDPLRRLRGVVQVLEERSISPGSLAAQAIAQAIGAWEKEREGVALLEESRDGAVAQATRAMERCDAALARNEGHADAAERALGQLREVTRDREELRAKVQMLESDLRDSQEEVAPLEALLKGQRANVEAAMKERDEMRAQRDAARAERDSIDREALTLRQRIQRGEGAAHTESIREPMIPRLGNEDVRRIAEAVRMVVPSREIVADAVAERLAERMGPAVGGIARAVNETMVATAGVAARAVAGAASSPTAREGGCEHEFWAQAGDVDVCTYCGAERGPDGTWTHD